MTARTKDRAKVGTTEFTARVRYLVTVDGDEERWDCEGGEWDAELGRYTVRYRDDFDGETFPTMAAARRWLKRRMTAKLAGGTTVSEGEIDTVRWDPDEYDDDTYGRILDAESVVVQRQRWYSVPWTDEPDETEEHPDR